MGWLQLFQEKAKNEKVKQVHTKILIIDDERDVLNTLTDLLKIHGFLVLRARSAEEGLRLYHEHQPQIIITDLRMPGMSGLELLHEIRKNDDHTEIIVLTAYNDSEMVIDALKNRASDFILKPVDSDTLKLTIDRALERLRLREKIRNYTSQLEELLKNVRVTRDYLQKIVESAPSAIIAYDQNGRITAWNSEAEKLTGYSTEDALGKKLEDIFILEGALISPKAKALQFKNVVAQIMTRSGELRFISRNANAILDEQGNVVGGIENFFDVTEQIKNDQLLEKRYLQLQTINEIGKKIASCNELQEISQFVSERLVKTFFESSQVSIYFYDPQKDALVLFALSGLNIDRIKNKFPIGMTMNKATGIVGHVFTHGKEIIATDVQKIPFFYQGSLENTHSEFAFPIRFKDRVFGVLNIENIENITLDETDRFMLEAIAEYLGIGKERIELMDKITEQNRQLEIQADKLRKALNEVENQKKIIEGQNKRLLADLQKAAEFQQSLLPEVLPELNDLKLAALYIPSSQLGGDFYDIIEKDGRYLAVILADASGHGVAAAMLSAMFKMTLHKYSDEILKPAVVLEKMNRDFSSILQMGEFFSAFLAVYDRQNKVLHYANAGHPRPLLYNYRTQQITELDTNGFLLGILSDGVEFEQKAMPLNDPTRLMIYTDGMNEAINAREEQFGTPRISNLMKKHIKKSPQDFVQRAKKSLSRFTGSNNFDDDLTIIVVDNQW
jgi:PAS domain S-box-containing protein